MRIQRQGHLLERAPIASVYDGVQSIFCLLSRRLFMHGLVGVSQLSIQLSNLTVSPPNKRFTPRHNFPAEQHSGYFRKRDEELAAIKSALQASCPGDIGRCAVWGMPGIGKSQLALAYAQREFSSSNYDLIIWISGTTAEKVVGGLMNALKSSRTSCQGTSRCGSEINCFTALARTEC